MEEDHLIQKGASNRFYAYRWHVFVVFSSIMFLIVLIMSGIALARSDGGSEKKVFLAGQVPYIEEFPTLFNGRAVSFSKDPYGKGKLQIGSSAPTMFPNMINDLPLPLAEIKYLTISRLGNASLMLATWHQGSSTCYTTGAPYEYLPFSAYPNKLKWATSSCLPASKSLTSTTAITASQAQAAAPHVLLVGAEGVIIFSEVVTGNRVTGVVVSDMFYYNQGVNHENTNVCFRDSGEFVLSYFGDNATIYVVVGTLVSTPPSITFSQKHSFPSTSMTLSLGCFRSGNFVVIDALKTGGLRGSLFGKPSGSSLIKPYGYGKSSEIIPESFFTSASVNFNKGVLVVADQKGSNALAGLVISEGSITMSSSQTNSVIFSAKRVLTSDDSGYGAPSSSNIAWEFLTLRSFGLANDKAVLFFQDNSICAKALAIHIKIGNQLGGYAMIESFSLPLPLLQDNGGCALKPIYLWLAASEISRPTLQGIDCIILASVSHKFVVNKRVAGVLCSASGQGNPQGVVVEVIESNANIILQGSHEDTVYKAIPTSTYHTDVTGILFQGNPKGSPPTLVRMKPDANLPERWFYTSDKTIVGIGLGDGKVLLKN